MKDAELAILSIIAEAPIAGCDVQDVIEARNIRLWTLLGVESIYYVIEKLESQGLIVNIDETPPAETRLRLYRVTSAGIGVLQTAVTELLASPRQFPWGFDLGLANLTVLSTAQVHHALKHYQAGLKARLADLEAQAAYAQAQSLPFHIGAMFQHQIALVTAEITWLEDWLPQWLAQAPVEEETPPAHPVSTPRIEQVILPHDPDSFHKHATRQHSPSEISQSIEFPPKPQRRLSTPIKKD